jgi:hypothetical protein
VCSTALQDSEVEIALNTAGTTRTPTPVAGTAEEDAIDELDVLLFDKNQKYVGRRRAYKLPVNYGYIHIYRATMPVGEEYTLHLLANCKALLDGKDPERGGGPLLTVGTGWSAIREELIDLPARLVPPASGFTPLPMWGTVADIDIQKDVVTRVNIEMLRGVASVDLDAHAVRDSFRLKEACLYFAPDRGYIAYTAIPVAPAYNTDPYVPGTMKTTLVTSAVEADARNQILSKLYLYENAYNTRDNSEKQRSRVIVGGQFKGKKDADWSPTSYYPIDFIKHETLPAPHDTYRKINRNWKYLFNIVEVSGPGYETPEIASENYPINMGISVIEWNQVHEEIIVDGPYYISLARREAWLYQEANAQDEIAVSSNIPAAQLEMTLLSGTNGAQTDVANGIRNDWFQVEKVLNNEGNPVAFRVTALQNYDASHATDAVEVTFGGRVKFTLSIEQLNQSQNGWDDGGGEDIEDL